MTMVFHGEGDWEGSMKALHEAEQKGMVTLIQEETMARVACDEKGEDHPGYRLVWQKSHKQCCPSKQA